MDAAVCSAPTPPLTEGSLIECPRGIATRYCFRAGGLHVSSTKDLIAALKNELKAAHVTYADLATHLDMAESSIKRMFSQADMPLSRIDEVLRVLRMDFADLARRVADAQPLRQELSMEQEALPASSCQRVSWLILPVQSTLPIRRITRSDLCYLMVWFRRSRVLCKFRVRTTVFLAPQRGSTGRPD